MTGYRRTLNLSSAGDGEGGSNGTCDTQDDVETSAILGLIVSLFSVGSLAGAITSGVFSELAGRKPAIILGACCMTVYGILHTSAINIWMVLPSRLIGGIGVGMLYQAIPLYVAEISPEEVRGRLLSLLVTYSLTATFIGTVVNLGVKNLLFGWRISVGVVIVVGLFLALGMSFLPRSPRQLCSEWFCAHPRWLVKKQKGEKALEILTKIYNKDENRAQVQIEAIRATVSSTKEPFLQTLKYILQWKIFQRLLLGMSMMFIGRLTGVNFILFFSVSLFCGIGLPGFAVSIAVAGACMVGILLTAPIVDKVGRKPILLIGLTVMCIMHVASAVIILTFDLENLADGNVSVSQTVAGYFVLLLQCVFVSIGNLSVGNVVWVVTNEFFPIRGRGIMTSLCNAAFWGSLVAVNQISPVLISSPLNIAGTLFLFAAVSFGNLLLVLLAIPETKGYTLEGIEELFSKPWSARTNPLFYLRCGCFLELVCGKKGRSYLQFVDTPEDHQLETVKELSEDGKTEEDSQGEKNSSSGTVVNVNGSVTVSDLMNSDLMDSDLNVKDCNSSGSVL